MKRIFFVEKNQPPPQACKKFRSRNSVNSIICRWATFKATSHDYSQPPRCAKQPPRIGTSHHWRISIGDPTWPWQLFHVCFFFVFLLPPLNIIIIPMKDWFLSGLSRVYEGQHTDTKDRVAVKVLERNFIREQKVEENVTAEIKVLQACTQHSNIVKLIEVIRSPTHIFLVMELMGGGSLQQRLVQHGRLSESMARRYFRQFMSAIAYLHGAGVSHRDISADNCQFTADGQQLKVSDFGFSMMQASPDDLLRSTCGRYGMNTPGWSVSCPACFVCPAEWFVSTPLCTAPIILHRRFY
jgi:tRNA A-37 threonylcarbamoyl transferase component Bud32